LGKKYAKAMARLLLNYPYPNGKEIQRYLTIHEACVIEADNIFHKSEEDELLKWIHNLDKKYDHLQGDQGACHERMEFVRGIFPYVSKTEQKELKDGSGFRWAIEKDYRIHESVCKEARQGAEIKLGAEIIRQSTGDSGYGIHWKSTIASWARGEKEIYVRDMRYKRESSLRFDEYTPAVFLFSEDFTHGEWSTVQDSNLTMRNIQLGNARFSLEQHPPPDHVYSVFYTDMKRETFCYGHIMKYYLSSITFLYSRHVMGTDRYNKIAMRPKIFQCRLTPTEDHELKAFPLSELGIAWAIKYAEKAVLIVARTGWNPSSSLQLYAKEKNIRVIHMPISSLRPEIIERLKIIYFISTPLKKHPNKDMILERFID